MKGNKKLLIVAILVLLTVTFSTYAIYRTSQQASASVKAAAWSIDIGSSAQKTANFVFDADHIQWTTHTGKNGTIAPGDSGTITIPVDADGSEVDVLLTAEIGSTANLPAGMTATVTSGTNGVQTIPYSATEGQMEANVVITVTWTGTIEDTEGKDSTDMAKQGANLSIPVTLTARQKLATD